MLQPNDSNQRVEVGGSRYLVRSRRLGLCFGVFWALLSLIAVQPSAAQTQKRYILGKSTSFEQTNQSRSLVRSDFVAESGATQWKEHISQFPNEKLLPRTRRRLALLADSVLSVQGALGLFAGGAVSVGIAEATHKLQSAPHPHPTNSRLLAHRNYERKQYLSGQRHSFHRTEGVEDEEDIAPIAGFVAYFGGAIGGVYTTRQFLESDTTDFATFAQVVGGHLGGGTATGLTVHLWNRRKGRLPETIGGALALPVVIVGSGLAVGGIAKLIGLEKVSKGIIHLTAWTALATPGFAVAGATYMDDYTRP